MKKNKLLIILRILVSLGLLMLLMLLARGNFAKISKMLSSLIISIFIWAFSFFLVSNFFIAWRLKFALSAQNAFFSIKDLFSLTLIGYFFTNFMPTSIGGDLVKGYYISKKVNRKLGSYTSIIFDRAIGLFSASLIAMIALAIMRESIEHKFIIWVVAVLLICCILFILSIFYTKLLQKISRITRIGRILRILKLELPVKKIYGAMNAYANDKKKILYMFILSIVAQFISFFSVFLLAKSLSVYVPFTKVLLLMPVIYVLCMLPITMNGLGLREWGFVFFFSPDIGSAAAFSLSLLYLTVFLLTSLIGGIIYLFWR